MSPRQNDLLEYLFNEAAEVRAANPQFRGMRGRDPITLLVTSVVGVLEAGAAAVGIGTAATVGGGLSAGAAAGAGLGGLAAGATAFGGFSVVGVVKGLALSVGLSYAANAIQRASMKDKGGFAVGVNATEMRLNTRQEVPPRRRVYGTPLVGGPLFFEDCIPPYYYRGFLLSDGPVDGIEAFYNSQTQITLDSGGLPLSDPYNGGFLQVSFRNGARDQAGDPILLADFPSLGVDFRQRQIACLVVKAKLDSVADNNEARWGSIGRPNPFVKLRGVPVYDPRDPSQILPTDPSDPDDLAAAMATWKHSRTASLIQADYLWWLHGGRVPFGKIRWDDVAESATWDEGKIETKSGELIARHTIDGVVTAGQSPLQVMTTMLSANRGFIARRGGHVTVISSQPKKPARTITDDWVLSGFDVRRTTPKSDVLNKLRARMIDPRQEWQMVDGPVLVDEDSIEAERDTYEGAVQFPWTERHERAQRLQKAAMDDTRLGKMLTVSVDMRGLGLEAGDVVRFYSEVAPRANGVYRIQEVQFDYKAKAFELVLAQYDEAIETAWVKDDEQEYELPELGV